METTIEIVEKFHTDEVCFPVEHDGEKFCLHFVLEEGLPTPYSLKFGFFDQM